MADLIVRDSIYIDGAWVPSDGKETIDVENPATEEVYLEIQKFLTLALKANPNVLECLYTPIVEHASALAREMLTMRGTFLSKLVYQTYNP